jgi:hypothetical protein
MLIFFPARPCKILGRDCTQEEHLPFRSMAKGNKAKDGTGSAAKPQAQAQAQAQAQLQKAGAFRSNKAEKAPSAGAALAASDANVQGGVLGALGSFATLLAGFLALFMAFQIRLHAVINYGKVRRGDGPRRRPFPRSSPSRGFSGKRPLSDALQRLPGKLLESASGRGISIRHIQPGKPQQSAYIER